MCDVSFTGKASHGDHRGRSLYGRCRWGRGSADPGWFEGVVAVPAAAFRPRDVIADTDSNIVSLYFWGTAGITRR